jgi:hypothetical protein
MNNAARTTFGILGVLILLALGAYVFVMGRAAGTPLPPDSVLTPLPTSPLDATYNIEGHEVQLAQGRAEEDSAPGAASKTVTQIFGEPVYGDVNDDGANDAALLLSVDAGGSGTFYYVAVALKDGEGYLGTNAILLGDRIAPQTVEIRNGVVIANFAERAPDAAMTDQPTEGVSAYLTVSGALLSRVVVAAGEMVLSGVFASTSSEQTFDPCSGGSYPLAPDSNSRAALTAIYQQRNAERETMGPVFMVLAGTVVPDTSADAGSAASLFKVSSIVSAPRTGSCTRDTGPASAQPPTAATPTQPLTQDNAPIQ